MRILVVSNLYPPQHLGGYEIGCRDIVEQLRSRGHFVQVLTSSFRHDDRAEILEEGIERKLHFANTPDGSGLSKWREWQLLGRAADQFQPEVILFFNLAGLSFWLPIAARTRGYPTIFLLSDKSFTAWRVGAWLLRWSSSWRPLSRLCNALFGRTFLVRGWPVTQHQTCIFVSRYLQAVAESHGIHVASKTSTVAHWGIAATVFARARDIPAPMRRLLFVGRISPQKGVKTAIAALNLLANGQEGKAWSLSLVGGGPDLDYIRQMRVLSAEWGLEQQVKFFGEVPRDQLPQIYRDHDVLVFPSEWDEPFAITPLEAMAAGLAVVGTTTGGSGELFRDRETAMVFEAGNAQACAEATRVLCSDRALYERICRQGAAEVAEHHTLEGMVAVIEKALRRKCLGEP